MDSIYVVTSFGYGGVPSGVWNQQHKVVCEMLYKVAAFFCICVFLPIFSVWILNGKKNQEEKKPC